MLLLPLYLRELEESNADWTTNQVSVLTLNLLLSVPVTTSYHLNTQVLTHSNRPGRRSLSVSSGIPGDSGLPHTAAPALPNEDLRTHLAGGQITSGGTQIHGLIESNYSTKFNVQQRCQFPLVSAKRWTPQLVTSLLRTLMIHPPTHTPTRRALAQPTG